MKNTDIPYELIAKYYRRECSSSELQALEAWRKMSGFNENIFEELQSEWLLIHDEEKTYPDKNVVWKRINDQIHRNEKVISIGSKSFVWKVVGIAASIALLIGIGSTFIIQKNIQTRYQSEQITVISAPSGQKTHLTLPDGTQVWLNSNSSISYSANFNNLLREINLEGEAFFDVAKDREKEFIVKTGDIKVTVLGTAFDVMAYPDEEEIKVSLLRGKVALSGKSDIYFGELHPNQLAVISKKDMKYALYDNRDAETFSSWTQNRLIFYNAGIQEVIAKLERWYGVKINLVNPDVNQKYSFSVKTESLHEILNLFNKVTPVNYVIEGEEVTIIRK